MLSRTPHPNLLSPGHFGFLRLASLYAYAPQRLLIVMFPLLAWRPDLESLAPEPLAIHSSRSFGRWWARRHAVGVFVGPSWDSRTVALLGRGPSKTPAWPAFSPFLKTLLGVVSASPGCRESHGLPTNPQPSGPWGPVEK